MHVLVVAAAAHAKARTGRPDASCGRLHDIFEVAANEFLAAFCGRNTHDLAGQHVWDKDGLPLVMGESVPSVDKFLMVTSNELGMGGVLGEIKKA